MRKSKDAIKKIQFYKCFHIKKIKRTQTKSEEKKQIEMSIFIFIRSNVKIKEEKEKKKKTKGHWRHTEGPLTTCVV
jgi:hypothetical protein